MPRWRPVRYDNRQFERSRCRFAPLRRNGMSGEDIRAALANLKLNCALVDEEIAVECGLLIHETRSAGLSLGDRACLALARKLATRALTGDRSWSQIAKSIGVDIAFIR